jgi:hypothetical protein
MRKRINTLEGAAAVVANNEDCSSTSISLASFGSSTGTGDGGKVACTLLEKS